ncbi:kinase-like protein, partial [Clavulina sp. PMI_390]
REIVTQIRLHHPNILPILGVSSNDTHPLSIITPLAPNGNALDYLRVLGPAARGPAMLKIVTGISSALSYIHNLTPPVVHGDLHGGNILVGPNSHGFLNDFGIARIKHEKTRTATHIEAGGHELFLAPELLRVALDKWRTTAASDCYTFSMTILQLATLQRPFVELDTSWHADDAAMQGKRPNRPPLEVFNGLNAKTVDFLWGLLRRMWQHDPTKRPNMRIVHRCMAGWLANSHKDATSTIGPAIPHDNFVINGSWIYGEPERSQLVK